jgi:hypothetical protein
MRTHRRNFIKVAGLTLGATGLLNRSAPAAKSSTGLAADAKLKFSGLIKRHPDQSQT